MTIQERAAKVLQEIDAALALAEKATPGPLVIKPCGDELQLISRRGVPWVCPCDSPNKDNDAAFITAARTGWPTALRCLKTAIEELLPVSKANYDDCCDFARNTLTTICNQWQSK